MGRHSRINDCSLLDPLNLRAGARLGHTDFVVSGGRADPSNILNGVWVLNAPKMDWKLVQCTDNVFPPRVQWQQSSWRFMKFLRD
ncbi:hypothetical protein OIU84_002182 [Salix udensis]|uniref:Uncharacterized protein n=1 Tax=Salix udensis TaxID=889485 RepID=A0AAD6K5K0_9ROSI|nr:hypothetical protein OIU84_002182 [Salix udensis]